MNDTGTLEVCCTHCGQWLATSVAVLSGELLDTAELVQARFVCPHCQGLTGCDRGNMRIRFPEDH